MIYILRSDGVYASYEGQTIEQIISMLATMGLTGVVVDKATYDAALEARPPWAQG